MRALRAVLNDANRQEACAIYTADALGAVAGQMFRMGGANMKLPLFSDLMKPPEPELTADEIKAKVMRRLDEMEARR